MARNKNKRKNVKSANKEKKIFSFWFVSGLLAGLIIFLLAIIAFRIKPDKKIVSPIIPPYYDQKAFVKPKVLDEVKNITPAASTEANMKIPIVMYHYVEYVQDLKDFIRMKLDITPHEFDRELKTLKDEGYKTYFVKEVPNILNGEILRSPKSIVLSFDDGYEDFYRDVFPILKKYHMKATQYVIYDFIGRKGFLKDSEIKEMIESGLIEIGSHTLDHLALAKLPEKQAEKQIIESKELFEKRFGIKIETFAYPYGSFDKTAIDIVRKAGYKAAVSVIPGTLQSENNIFYLNRIRAGYLETPNMIHVLDNFK